MKIKKLSESIDVNNVAHYIIDKYEFDDMQDKHDCINSIRDSFKNEKTISKEELEQFIGAHNGRDKVNESKSIKESAEVKRNKMIYTIWDAPYKSKLFGGPQGVDATFEPTLCKYLNCTIDDLSFDKEDDFLDALDKLSDNELLNCYNDYVSHALSYLNMDNIHSLTDGDIKFLKYMGIPIDSYNFYDAESAINTIDNVYFNNRDDKNYRIALNRIIRSCRANGYPIDGEFYEETYWDYERALELVDVLNYIKNRRLDESKSIRESKATHCVYFTQDGIEQIEFEGTEDECDRYISAIQAEQDDEFGDEAPERFIKRLTEGINDLRNKEGQVMADKWYARTYPNDEVGIEQLKGITLDDALKDRKILGHCDTQVRDRVYAQLDKYIPLSKESPMYKEKNESKHIKETLDESLFEASYGGAFDIADDQYFTREDIESASEPVLEHINETFNDKYVLGGTWFENGKWIVNVQTENGMEEYEAQIDVDTNKIKSARDLKEYVAGKMAAALISQIKEFNESFDTSIKVGDKVHVDVAKKDGIVKKVNGEYIDVETDDGKNPIRIDTYYKNEVKKMDGAANLSEDMTTDAEPIKTGSAVGMAQIISDLIKDEYEAIDGYNSAIATAESEGYSNMIEVLTDIQAEENVHIGQLQELMKMVDPNASKIEDGEREAKQELSDTSVEEI